MCGLTGIFDSRGRRPIDPVRLRTMRDALAHRGPDGAGEMFAPGIALGHRRLSVIDPAGGHQPMFNEDGTVAVVFNGEIYNFQALATELERRGHVFRSRCDTEVIAHGFEEWGPDCVRHFQGMFALAVWDGRTETLFLARDRLGKKPLYHATLADGRVLFGSELKALLCHPDLPRDIDPTAVANYLAFGYVPDPGSLYRAVAKLPPAHTLTWRRGEAPRLACYWRLSYGADTGAPLPVAGEGAIPRRSAALTRTADAAADELIPRVRAAVSRRLIADVPLGAFLSGGVDSSGVVALMASLSPDPVHTFSIAFPGHPSDESPYAAEMATRYGTDHHVQAIDPRAFDLLDIVDELAGIYDEPFADSSALPTVRLCAAARQGVTVALSGDGGDELFAGYRRYPWHVREEWVRRRLPRGVRRSVFGLLGTLYPKLDQAPRVLRARSTFRELALDTAEAYCASVSVIDDSTLIALTTPAFRRALSGHRPADVIKAHMQAADSDDPFRQAQAADLKTWLAGDILVKVDRASMAHGLEVRAPLLDTDLLEWTAGLDTRLILDGGTGKALLKRGLSPLVSAHLLHRRKQGFSVPLRDWFRGPLQGRLRAALGPGAAGLAATGWFDPAAITRLMDQHQSGRRDHGPVLWSLLMLDAVLRRQG